MQLLLGVSSECAYQTFKLYLDADGAIISPKPGEPVTVTVDGLFADIECLLLEDYKEFVDPDSEFFSWRLQLRPSFPGL